MVGGIAECTAEPGPATSIEELSDEELLVQFLDAGEPASQEAFHALVARHGPRVLRICRHVLNREHDAEDAFQATFLALARNGASIRDRCALGGWLQEVAYRTALKTRARRSRRQAVERQVMVAYPRRDVGDDQGDRASLAELRPMLHEEVTGLPDKYRIPVVLSYLEGKTNEEVAAILNWPVGTVKGRLSRGRALLRSRLTRRGIALTTSALLVALSRSRASAAPVPEGLVRRTLRKVVESGVAGTSGRRSGPVPTATDGRPVPASGAEADPVAISRPATPSRRPGDMEGPRHGVLGRMISGVLVLISFIGAVFVGGCVSSAAYGGRFPGWRSAVSGLLPAQSGRPTAPTIATPSEGEGRSCH